MAGAIYAALQAGPKSKRQRYEQLASAMWSERSTFDSHWREIADFLVPTRTRFNSSQRNQGGKRNQKIIDSTGRFAYRTLQSGLHAGMTSPARPWFNLTTPDPDLAKFKPVKEWLHIVTGLMRVIFTDSNLYNTFPTVYGDVGLFGTGAMSMMEDTGDDLFRTRTYPIGSYAIAQDDRGDTCAFVRHYERTVLQVVEQFGVRPGSTAIDWSNISKTVRQAWELGNYTMPVDITWVIQKNIGYTEGKIGPDGFPYLSCHFERGESKENLILAERGFHEFPIMAPRWDLTDDDTYGTDCPGMIALGDVIQLQGMQREKNKAIQKLVSPPMKASPELRTQKTSIISGDITYVRDPQHNFTSVHDVNLHLGDLRENIRDVQYLIQRAFYEDLFLLMARADDTQRTATEIAERKEEKLIALGPMHDRMNDELLNHVINRAYKMMERAKMLPPPPQEIQGVKLRVEYQSIMAAAQRLIGVVAQDRFIGSVAPLLQADPSLRFKINGRQIIDNYAEMTGVDPRIVVENEEAERMANAEAEQVAKAQEAERAALMAKAGKDASQAPMASGGSLLDQLTGAGSETVQ